MKAGLALLLIPVLLAACALPRRVSVATVAETAIGAAPLPFPPRGRIDMHDPSTIVEADGYLMLYITGSGPGKGIESRFLAPGAEIWQAGVPLLAGDRRPAWITDRLPNNDGAFWAPDQPDARTVYYSVSDMTEPDRGCIGRATANGSPPDLVWTDDGAPVTCSNPINGGPFAIDPSIFQDEGRVWMVFGSHWDGIFIVELDPQSGHLAEAAGEGWSAGNDAFHHVASYADGASGEANTIEAPYVYQRGDYYYLFVNWDRCCNGVNSTYNIRVGRSQAPTGPYLDRTGVDMARGGGTLLLESEGDAIGPGHAGIYVYEEAGEPVFMLSHHYYDKRTLGGATFGAVRLTWDEEGWPVVRR